MINFLKYTLASIIGTILTFVIIFFIFVGIISVSTQKEPVMVKDNSILKLNLTKLVQERQPVNPFSQFSFSDDGDVVLGLNSIKASIKSAKNDPKIKGIYIDANVFLDGGMATIEEIRNELLNFKTSGKFIIAYGENFSQKAYYLASVADKIYLSPMGIIDFKGINGQVTFFKNALEKLEIDVQIIRGPDNKFKSAVEPFMNDKMSEANKEQTSVFLGSIWDNILSNISVSRKISKEKLQYAADKLLAYDATSALQAGLIDGNKYWDEVEEELKTLTKTNKSDDINFINLGKYEQTVKSLNRKSKNKIAIIYANGEIQSGEGDDQTMGSDRIAKAIKDARNDSSIKAIVFRINSPGGSAQASEIIYRELELTKGVKPIVVSMGDYAASGGYYIACNADKIYAQPTTLTGSIGVFGMIPNFQKLVNNKLGITFDGIKTAENADIYSLIKPITPYQSEVIHKMINNIYSTFLQHVADGRKMTTSQVDSIGQGRVWSGIDALKIGLVDELGGIDEAILYAADLANITDYKTTELPIQKNPLDELIKQLNGEISMDKIVIKKLGVYGEYFNFISNLDKKDQIQARLPFLISIN
jgi:protease IV